MCTRPLPTPCRPAGRSPAVPRRPPAGRCRGTRGARRSVTPSAVSSPFALCIRTRASEASSRVIAAGVGRTRFCSTSTTVRSVVVRMKPASMMSSSRGSSPVVSRSVNSRWVGSGMVVLGSGVVVGQAAVPLRCASGTGRAGRLVAGAGSGSCPGSGNSGSWPFTGMTGRFGWLSLGHAVDVCGEHPVRVAIGSAGVRCRARARGDGVDPGSAVGPGDENHERSSRCRCGGGAARTWTPERRTGCSGPLPSCRAPGTWPAAPGHRGIRCPPGAADPPAGRDEHVQHDRRWCHRPTPPAACRDLGASSLGGSGVAEPVGAGSSTREIGEVGHRLRRCGAGPQVRALAAAR